MDWLSGEAGSLFTPNKPVAGPKPPFATSTHNLTRSGGSESPMRDSAISTACGVAGSWNGCRPSSFGNFRIVPVLRFGSLAHSLMRATSSSSDIATFSHVAIRRRHKVGARSRYIFLVAGDGFEPPTFGL